MLIGAMVLIWVSSFNTYQKVQMPILPKLPIYSEVYAKSENLRPKNFKYRKWTRILLIKQLNDVFKI